MPSLGRLLSGNHFRFFFDKLAASFIARYYSTIFKCRRIADMGAQQVWLRALSTLSCVRSKLFNGCLPFH